MGLDGRITIKRILLNRMGVKWNDLVQKTKWRAILKTLMTLRVPFNAGNLLVSCGTTSFTTILRHGRKILLHRPGRAAQTVHKIRNSFNILIRELQYSNVWAAPAISATPLMYPPSAAKSSALTRIQCDKRT